jgi:signal transduction histidine kinase
MVVKELSGREPASIRAAVPLDVFAAAGHRRHPTTPGPAATGPDLPTAGPEWVCVASPAEPAGRAPRRSSTVYLQVIAMTVVVLVGVAVFGASASRRVAENQAVAVAAQRADLLAQVVVQPALTDGVLTRDPAAVARLADAVRKHVVGEDINRVKFWTAEGLVVYSDDPRLIGRTFPLSDDQRAVLADRTARAEVTDLDKPENTLERGAGKLLEVYRPLRTPNGSVLVMETYSPYSTVDRATSDLWRGFTPITLASLLALMVLLLPVVGHLLRRLRRSQDQREALLERAVHASAEERRRIAATLHDGVVQDLVGVSLTVAGAAGRAAAHGHADVAADMTAAAATVRTSVGGLRSLLADIYPPSLNTMGLEAALQDLVASTRSRGLQVGLDCHYSAGKHLTKERERLLFRIVQECLNNAVRHSAATQVDIKMAEDDTALVLDVVDDGRGFDAEALTRAPKERHFGLRLMADAARQGDAELRVASAAGAGTHWQLRMQVDRHLGLSVP